MRELLAALLLLALATPAGADKADLQALLAGVKVIAAPGVPGPLCVFGPQAFPVVVGKSGKSLEAVVAAARWGAGRVVALGQDGYLTVSGLEAGDTRRLLANALLWVAGGKTGKVGLRRLPQLRACLAQRKRDLVLLDTEDWRLQLKSLKVLVVQAAQLTGPEDIQAVQEFVRQGGGLVVADLGWGWLQLNPGQRITDHPGNRLLSKAGILWAEGYLEPTAPTPKGFRVTLNPDPLTHAGRALERLASMQPSEAAQISMVLTRVAATLPEDDSLLLPRLPSGPDPEAPLPSHDKPLKRDNPRARLLLSLGLERSKRTAPEKLQAHPAAADFPGSVPPEAPRLRRKLDLDMTIPGWHSTGLYAPPGELIRVQAPSDLPRGVLVRLGAHTDRLEALESWSRAPDIATWTPLAPGPNRAANAFGGLIYLEVPGGSTGHLSFEIAGGVEAPLYILGRTGPERWRALRQAPAPWAELESPKIILTVPSRVVRSLEDPEAVLKWWDRVWDAEAELAGWPKHPVRAERIVADEQISAGYMHSGYPIMTHLDVAPLVVDRSRLASQGSWGHFHELGHNHQSPDWTFEGTGEVTCNLFTLYAWEKVVGPSARANPAFTPESRARARRAHRQAGSPWEIWKKEPFLALDTYVRVQEAFDWEPFRKVFAEYRGLPEGQRPKTDEEKRDQWMQRLSRAVGRNLGPYFDSWGIPTSPAARDSLKALPVWTPPDL